MDQSPYAVSDASRAIQSMILTAWSEGVGSNWVGFQNLEQIKPLLEIPAGLDVMAIPAFRLPCKNFGQGPEKSQAVGTGGPPGTLRNNRLYNVSIRKLWKIRILKRAVPKVHGVNQYVDRSFTC